MNSDQNQKKIFEPLKLNNLILKNRLLRSATWEGIAALDGSIDERIYSIYEEVSKGGVGGIISGFTSVDTNAHYFEGMMRLSDDKLIPQYKKLTDIVHKENCPILAQIALGAYYDKNEMEIYPDDMSLEDIQAVINLFIKAAERAKKANYDGVQIHAAHFFFLSRFISPLINHRHDQYGGNVENRARILVDILKGIKQLNLGLHVSLKINSSDFDLGGNDEDECVEICKIMAKEGIDSIEISGNGTSRSRIKAHVNEAYFLDTAKKVAEAVNIPIAVVGGLRSRKTMQNILDTTKIEILSLSRPLICQPDFPKMMEQGDIEDSKCISCNGCYRSKCHRCVVFKRKNK